MPLTDKGPKIMKSMKDEYGDKKGESVFYASANSGKIKGVHESLQSFHRNLAKRFRAGRKRG